MWQLAFQAAFHQRWQLRIAREPQANQLARRQLNDPGVLSRGEHFPKAHPHFKPDYAVLHPQRLRARREHGEQHTKGVDRLPDAVLVAHP